MPALAILGLLALPLAEIAAFVLVGAEIGVLATLGWVILAMLLGFALLRDQPMRAVVETRAAIARRQPPGRPLFDALCRTVAGVLLVVPGVVTDMIALLLLLPPLRGAIYRAVAGSTRAEMSVMVSGLDDTPRRPPSGPRVIEGEFTEVEGPPSDSGRRPPSFPPRP
jgi:UPF0716 protein FxsA